MRAQIRTGAISKHFGKLKAVDRVDLSINEGEVFGLLGPNGAGKTTLINMLSTLSKPTEGTAIVNGFDVITQSLQVRKSIGIVFQEPSVDDLLSGRENLELHGLLYGVPRELRRKRIKELMELVDLSDRADDPVKTYSGGMRRRLEIARGLLHLPKVLFLDEPTLGLDPATREVIWNYIKSLAKRGGVTILLTTHYMEEADALCDRIAIIDHGRIVVLGTPRELKEKLGGDVVMLKGKVNLARVRKLRFVKAARKANSEVMLTIDHAARNLQALLKVTGRVENVEVRTPTLNDVFLHYTGRQIREADAEGGFFERVIRSETVRA